MANPLFMVQTAQAKSLSVSRASLAPSSLQGWAPSGAEPGQSQPLPAPEVPRTAEPMGAPTARVSLGQLWITKCPWHISRPWPDWAFPYPQCHWRVLVAELSGQFCSSCSSMDKADQYPSWVAESILLPTLSELLLSLFSFFNYALKSLFLLILDFWWAFSLLKENK